jgi:hypothetical protein
MLREPRKFRPEYIVSSPMEACYIQITSAYITLTLGKLAGEVTSMLSLGFFRRLRKHQGLADRCERLDLAASRTPGVVRVGFSEDCHFVVAVHRSSRPALSTGCAILGSTSGSHRRIVDFDVAGFDNVTLGNAFSLAIADDTVERIGVDVFGTDLVEIE